MKKVFAAAALSAFASTAALAAPVFEPHAQAFATAAAKAPPLYALPYEEARQVLSTVQSSTVASPATVIKDDVWPVGPTGKVRVRIVRPENARGSLPAVMYFHGGGWVMGDRNTHDHLIRELSAQANAAVGICPLEEAVLLKINLPKITSSNAACAARKNTVNKLHSWRLSWQTD
ncbi:alpha/beta hydrolase [Sinorhizobium fredii]|uniref:alpha/beta hydrolase n=1 Tax=Rhizobium fredii TaxID=380 RepID=UPI001F48F9A8|nr:alpha/beta hydrolase [Sinorhizobium fredii]